MDRVRYIETSRRWLALVTWYYIASGSHLTFGRIPYVARTPLLATYIHWLAYGL